MIALFVTVMVRCNLLSTLRGLLGEPGIIFKMAAKASSAVNTSTVYADSSSIGLTGVVESSQHFLSYILPLEGIQHLDVKKNT